MEWATACLGRARPRGPEPEGLCHSNSRVECAPLRRTLDNEESFCRGSRSVKTHAATILTLAERRPALDLTAESRSEFLWVSRHGVSVPESTCVVRTSLAGRLLIKLLRDKLAKNQA